MRERDIEAALVARVGALDGAAYKFTSPGRSGVPDRLALLRISPEHREIVAKYVRFIELKAPGAEPTVRQMREHQRLRDLGFRVDVIDNLEDAKGWTP